MPRKSYSCGVSLSKPGSDSSDDGFAETNMLFLRSSSFTHTIVVRGVYPVVAVSCPVDVVTIHFLGAFVRILCPVFVIPRFLLETCFLSCDFLLVDGKLIVYYH